MDRMKLALHRIITGVDSTGAFVYKTAWVSVPKVIAAETDEWLCEILEQDGETDEIKIGFSLPTASVVVRMRIGPFVYRIILEEDDVRSGTVYTGLPVVISFAWEGKQYHLPVSMDKIKPPPHAHMNTEKINEQLIEGRAFTYVTFGIYKK